MFYDMGATSTTATIAEYKTVQVKEGGLAEMVPQLSIKVHKSNLYCLRYCSFAGLLLLMLGGGV